MPEEVQPAEYDVRPDPLRVCDMPAQLRPREEFERVGAENVSDAVLFLAGETSAWITGAEIACDGGFSA